MKKLYESVVYVNENNIAGDFVECGVYQGGSVMNMALAQLQFDRKISIWLYDTFEGMPPPTEYDVNHKGVPAQKILRRPSKRCVCSLEEVKKNMSMTGYPQEFLRYRKGDVAVTLRQNIPAQISLLRLDVDWYEPTKIGLETLYPKLAHGGVLILDDYGYWRGSRKATDDYFASLGVNPAFEPIDEGVGAVFHIKK